MQAVDIFQKTSQQPVFVRHMCTDMIYDLHIARFVLRFLMISTGAFLDSEDSFG